MNYHWCFWRDIDGLLDRFTPLPLGIGYSDAKAIVTDQAVTDTQERETYWCLGSIYVDRESEERVKSARIVWRLHVDANAPAFTNEVD